MDMNKIMNGRPRIAVLDPNTLAVLGLKNILQNVLPIMEVDTFSSFDEFLTADPDSFFHYFAAQTVVLGGKNFPEMPQVLKNKILSNREIEVLSLVVQGFINKEIATKLNISLTTVITHRKNIMEKLGMKSVSALTIYAVMHGYVDISKI